MGAIHPRSLVRLTSLAERGSRVLGLHRPSYGQTLSTLDIEIRRRVWWQVVLLDTRAAELSACGTSILSSDWNVPFPLNVNENDIKPDADTLPESIEGVTDMVFCLLRCEIAEFLRHIRSQKRVDFRWNEFSSLSQSLADKLDVIELFQKHIYTKYIDRCDSAIPVHVLTRYYALHCLSKMRIVAYRTLSYPDRPLTRAAMLERQDKLMCICIEAIEGYHHCSKNKLLKEFSWFSTSCFPFLAYVHLLFNLRTRTDGALVDRAWDILTVWNGNPRWLSALNPTPFGTGDETIQRAFAKLALAKIFLAAWDARRSAQANIGPEEPDLIVRMREKLADDTLRQATRSQELEDGHSAVKAATMTPKLQEPELLYSAGVPQAVTQPLTVQGPEIEIADFSDIFLNYDPTLGDGDWETLLSFEAT